MRPHRWLQSRRWWRAELARDVGTLLLGLAAMGAWANGIVDEVGDNTSIEALARQNDRTAFEQECRFDEAQPVAQLEAEQFDLLVDLAIARGAQDVGALQRGLAELSDLRRRKLLAVADRADAVAECDRRAAALFDGS